MGTKSLLLGIHIVCLAHGMNLNLIDKIQLAKQAVEQLRNEPKTAERKWALETAIRNAYAIDHDSYESMYVSGLYGKGFRDLDVFSKPALAVKDPSLPPSVEPTVFTRMSPEYDPE